MIERKKVAGFLFLAAVVVGSCSANGTTVADSQPFPESVTPVLEHTATFEVEAWIDDPSPPSGARVILHGSLLKDGVHLGGMAMRAVWPDEQQERGVPNCSVQVIYGAGVCIVESDGFQPGVYVPITVTFEYQGQFYSGETGFTPR